MKKVDVVLSVYFNLVSWTLGNNICLLNVEMPAIPEHFTAVKILIKHLHIQTTMSYFRIFKVSLYVF